MAGGEWPKRAREAALTAHDAAGGDDASRLEVLVADIRDAFAAKGTPARDMFGAEKVELPSQTMVKFLISREGHPWAEMGKSGKPLTQNRLARMLKDLGIKPVKVGPEDKRVQGYVLAEFEDAFARYLSEGAFKPDIRTEAREMGTSDIFEPDSPDPGCPVEKCEKPNNDGPLSTCPVAKGGSGEEVPPPTPGVPFMITRAMRERLRRRGYTDAHIDELTPQQAHEIDGASASSGERPTENSQRTLWGVTFHVLGAAQAGTACRYCNSAEPDEEGVVVVVANHGPLHAACAPAWITNQDKSK